MAPHAASAAVLEQGVVVQQGGEHCYQFPKDPRTSIFPANVFFFTLPYYTRTHARWNLRM